MKVFGEYGLVVFEHFPKVTMCCFSNMHSNFPSGVGFFRNGRKWKQHRLPVWSICHAANCQAIRWTRRFGLLLVFFWSKKIVWVYLPVRKAEGSCRRNASPVPAAAAESTRKPNRALLYQAIAKKYNWVRQIISNFRSISLLLECNFIASRNIDGSNGELCKLMQTLHDRLTRKVILIFLVWTYPCFLAHCSCKGIKNRSHGGWKIRG